MAEHRVTGIHAALGGVAVVFAAVGVVAASLGHEELGAVPVLIALALAWIATRPLHPPVPPLYRARVRSAWDDWLDALHRWNAVEDERGAAERERATDGLAERLAAMKPPPADREEHAERVRTVRAYAAALRECHAAQRAGDEAALGAAAERLHAVRETLA
jgi:hypothetical protein